MKRFIRKLAFHIAPLALLFIVIILTDPYKILYSYENYSYKHFTVNRHYVSTQYYLDHYQQYKYNAFIFGNSRTLAFQTTDWTAYLPPQSTPYHFDASGESVYGLMKKVEIIDRLDETIDDALIVLDRLIFLEPDEREHPLFQLHPSLNQTSWVKFYHAYFLSIFDHNFIPYYADYITNGLVTKVSDKIPKEVIYTPVHNDIFMSKWEEALAENENAFFSRYSTYFIERPDHETVSEVVIIEKHKEYLSSIKTILDQHHTNYKIILGPDYRQVKFNPEDLEFLTKLFGSENLYDFSGKNKFTEEVKNFYDGSHYRPFVAREILQKVYDSAYLPKTPKKYISGISD